MSFERDITREVNRLQAQIDNLIKPEVPQVRALISVHRNGVNQSIASGSFVKVEFTTEVYDNESSYDNVTNYRYTAPRDEYIHISAAVGILTLAAGSIANVFVYVDGAQHKRGSLTYAHAANDNVYVNVGCDIKLSSGSFVEIFAFHDHGSNRNVDGGADDSYFMIHRIGVF